MSTLELIMAQTLLRNCKMRTKSFLSGLAQVTEQEMTDAMQCVFGKWLQGEGKSAYGTSEEWRTAEKAHQAYHRTVKKILDMRKQGLFFNPEQEMTKLEEFSQEAAYGLEALKKRLDAK
ncbi:MAG: CZB domain-containing protein [Candidatus Omnitrophica bacterium]|nr:CZB domain-containing protein [Candidatus Omnitrophota bacterium]